MGSPYTPGSEHGSIVETVQRKPKKYMATCKCGWSSGEVRDSVSDTDQDYDQHADQVRRNN